MQNDYIQNLDDFSSVIGLVALLLSIQSSILDRREDKRSQKIADQTIIISVYLALMANLIDLGTAKATYDEITSSERKPSKRQLEAAQDLVTSRVFSVIAAIYLIRATIKSTGEEVTAAISPSPTGAI